jgi:hypothetical protein
MTFRPTLLATLVLAGAATLAIAQTGQTSSTPASPQQETAQPPASQEATPPKGTVLFQSHGEPPTTPPVETTIETATKPTGPELTDAERSAPTLTAYDLDARLTLAGNGLAMRAGLTIRNDGSDPLHRIALQISSTLHWQSATLISGGKATPLEMAQHLLETDADHTGKASEAILTLPAALNPGDSITIDTFYSGTIEASAGRLERIGATEEQAQAADWDAISPASTALRGFGNVLWYPVAAPQLFLGDGAQLFDAIGQSRVREAGASIRLRIAIEYHGEAPPAVYFCGRRQPFKALSDDADAPISEGTGIATAEFPAEPLGDRTPSLFVLAQPETLIAPLPGPSSTTPAASPESSSSAPTGAPGPDSRTRVPTEVSGSTTTDNPMLAVETTDDALLTPLAASAESIAPLLQQWFGTHPLTTLTVIDHDGQPFEDGPLLVAPAAALSTAEEAPALAHSMTHAWVQTGQPWMDEGLAQFMSLLWIEREHGRDAAISQLNDLLQPLPLSEPSFDTAAAAHAADAPPGQPLITATGEIYYRRKAAAVWWMLSGITGPDALHQALSAWRTQAPSHESPAAQAVAFEKLLERTSNMDLGWFFDDWVLHDRGLPDLSIVDVTPRQLPAGQGHNSGWLVAVTVHNAGAPEVDVPVIIRSGTFSTTKHLRVPGFGDATDRVLVEAQPTEVVVNDGETPELRTSQHTRKLVERVQ